MITSMNQSELYKTLVGHYKTSHYTYFPEESTKPAEKKNADTINGIPIDEFKKSMQENNLKDKPYIDLANDPNFDRIDFSTLKIAESRDIGLYTENLGVIPYAASEGIDFMSNGIRSELGSGCANGVATKERIAEYYGAMAKRLDEAYAEGKFTKDEFDELSEMITAQIEKEAEVSERKTAFYALGEKRYSLSPEAVSEIVQREKSMTPEERLAAREQEIRDYAERYCKIDRVALMKLFISIRYGK